MGWNEQLTCTRHPYRLTRTHDIQALLVSHDRLRITNFAIARTCHFQPFTIILSRVEFAS